MTWTYALDQDFGLPPDELKALVGGKAAGLNVMLRPPLSLPVPPGFVVSTAACRAFLADGWPDGIEAELRSRMAELEAAVGRRFGDAEDPLLVSVRSGAPVSMPGMMDTILNLGLTPGAAAGDDAFTRALRERLEAGFRDIVGVDTVPDDPWQQLRLAVEAVFRSWNGDRARAYRRREGIADDLGTAVVVQAMVFGNRGPDCATGVVFTRNPATGEAHLYGDVLFGAQGEDVVAGTHTTEPIEMLNERLPRVGRQLREIADRLERHERDLCDIEFTIEDGRLWMLQIRVGKRSPQAALRIAREMAEDEAFPLTRPEAVDRVMPLLADPPKVAVAGAARPAPLTTGLGASPGVASGEIALTPEAAERAAEAGRSVVLVRSETSPEDVHGMSVSAGILTARGGLASHAAVVARGWGIPAVVGASGVEVGDGSASIGGRSFREGAVISIDGATGEVFEGSIAGATEVVPDAAVLLGWAKELGIAVESAEPVPAAASAEVGVGVDDVVRRVGTKGFATAAQVADALLTTPEAVQPILDGMAAEGLVSSVAGAYRLTESGSARAVSLLAADREAWGSEPSAAAIDAFHALDQRMKEIVTAWQLKPGAGEPVVNDHADTEYDRSVLDRLADLHADACAFLERVEASSARLAGYRARLTRALAQARAGDQKFVASPRVDSYHGIWFELHEDLIGLAGRTREEEAAAGRA
jgi:pyruvate,orthophosphate dikinase